MTCAAEAEILEASDTHYVLRQSSHSDLSVEDLWQRLIDPAEWWHDDHTYSGDSGNLSLDVQAGGLWREDWAGGSVLHGMVLFVEPGAELRLDAPFGPLQGLGAHTIWTITVTADGEGSVAVFDEISSAAAGSRMMDVAQAVDAVKSQAIERLTSAGPAP